MQSPMEDRKQCLIQTLILENSLFENLSAHNLQKAELNEWTKKIQEQLNLFIKQINDYCEQLQDFCVTNPHAEKVWEIYFNWILGM